MKKITFAVEDVSKIEESDDPNFISISIDAFASGQNLHNMYVSDETLIACAPSILDVPVVWRYDKWMDDAGGHDPDEQICGFVNRLNNSIKFKRMSDGRLMMSVMGKIWRRYSGNLIDILKRDGGKKAVSVEMEVSDFDKIKSEIKSFVMRAVTIIGVAPAIPDAQLSVLSFSADKENYYKKFESTFKLKIDNSKESAFMDEVNFSKGRNLYGKMLDAPNSEMLVQEAYLSVGENWQNSPSNKLKFPHHIWDENNRLCVSRIGVENAMSQLQAQGITSGKEVNHLRRHCVELGLENFSVEFKKEVTTLEKEKEKVMMEEKVEPKEEKKAEVKEGKQPETKENPKKEEKQVETKEEKAEPKEEKKEEVDYAAKMVEYEAKLQDYACKTEKFEAELSELRKYKADREEQDKNFAVEQLFSEVGGSLPKDKTEEFRAEAKELKLAEFTAFSNKVKACTFDVAKKSPSKITTPIMAVNMPEKETKKNEWW